MSTPTTTASPDRTRSIENAWVQRVDYPGCGPSRSPRVCALACGARRLPHSGLTSFQVENAPPAGSRAVMSLDVNPRVVRLAADRVRVSRSKIGFRHAIPSRDDSGWP